MKTQIEPEVADEVPWSEKLTDYDQLHFITYMRLLDAQAVGACEAEISRLVLRIDPITEPDRSRRAFDSHLRRARWMTEQGYKALLDA